MKHLLLLVLLLLPLSAEGQRYSVGTNAVDWMTLGTLNAEASVAVARYVSLHVGAELNPWTFHASDPDRQMQLRQNSYWAGARWWPWHVYSGWWTGADFRYTVYNGGGIRQRDTEEGDAFGLGLWGGYAVMLSDRWNLDLGAGFWCGWTHYKTYSCPQCGHKTDEGEKSFILPDARIAFQWIF